jgi:hypothetical protein
LGNELHIEPETYQQVVEHLLKNSTEQVAFVFADVTARDNGVVFRTSGLYLVPPEDFQFQSGYHISLTDDGLARVIKMAWDKQTALIDLHSHVADLFPAQFSPSDLYGFREWVPHIWWRLKGKPVLAAVVSPSSFDALVWRLSPNEPEGLVALHVADEVKSPTGLTMKALERIRGQREV